MSFDEFDPLRAKQTFETEVAINAMKRELTNILDSYVGWYDPFAELIQNALDSVEEQAKSAEEDYVPNVRILINLRDNVLTVTDNGTGLSKAKYEQFLAPSFSFKSGKTRGHKGVGATYLAYGFNYVQISTKTADFVATGKMIDARKWLSDPNPAANPKVQPDHAGPVDKALNHFNSGVSISIKCDPSTYPGDLKWLRAYNAKQWLPILKVKTGLGAFVPNEDIKIELLVTDPAGNVTIIKEDGIGYYWPHAIVRKNGQLREVKGKIDALYRDRGPDFKYPGALTNLEAIWDRVTAEELRQLVSLNDTEWELVEKYKPEIYFCYMYSAKVWGLFNEQLEIRQGTTIITGGVQIGADNMPQGELIQIPLSRNIGRQHQMHSIIHFSNCSADLGRKGFQKEIVELSKEISRLLIDKTIQKYRALLRPVTGVLPDLLRESAVDEWKQEMIDHETNCPLELTNENFFLPVNRVSITSVPTREQDVIALFNQLLAGGVIRGIRVMSTNERFTYDGMYRVVFDPPVENHIYDGQRNPLGVLADYVEDREGFIRKPKILEYKYSLDALIEDIETGEKNSNDIGLVVVWESGTDWKEHYILTSLIDPDNLSDRQYHGVTHVLTNVTTMQREMDVVILSDLIAYLNAPEDAIEVQRQRYDV